MPKRGRAMSDKTTARSPRERKLAAITLALAVFAVAAWALRGGMDRLDYLDRHIAQLEQEIVNLNAQRIEAESAGAVFAALEEGYVSSLSSEELHDALRREIFRLALRDPDSQPPRGPSAMGSQFLVQIPSLDQGQVKREGEGFREYSIRVRIPGSTLANLTTFLDRLHSSPQLLRVDYLELTRPPRGRNVAAVIEVTRMVLDRPAEPQLF